MVLLRTVNWKVLGNQNWFSMACINAIKTKKLKIKKHLFLSILTSEWLEIMGFSQYWCPSPRYLLSWQSLSFLPLTKNILYCFPTALRLAPNLQTNVQSCSSRLQIYCSFLSSSSLAQALSLSPTLPSFSLLDNSHDMFLPLGWGVPFSMRGE